MSAEKAPESEEEFIRNLFKLWFYSYSRGEARCASSGFEHVFVGEIDSKGDEEQAAGLHNWIQFYFRKPLICLMPRRQSRCFPYQCSISSCLFLFFFLALYLYA